jgi:hypothetical protein
MCVTLEETKVLHPGALLREGKNFHLVDQRPEGSIILISEPTPGLSREFKFAGRWIVELFPEEGDSHFWEDFHRVA